MKRENVFLVIAGMLILAYVLDGVANPLVLELPSPYHYFTSGLFSTYVFSTTSIMIKGAALTMASVWFLSFLEFGAFVRGAILLVMSGLMQLYALQDIATNARVLPLEWSLPLSVAGVLLLVVSIGYLIIGLTHKVGQMVRGEDDEAEGEPSRSSEHDDDFFKTL